VLGKNLCIRFLGLLVLACAQQARSFTQTLAWAPVPARQQEDSAEDHRKKHRRGTRDGEGPATVMASGDPRPPSGNGAACAGLGRGVTGWRDLLRVGDRGPSVWGLGGIRLLWTPWHLSPFSPRATVRFVTHLGRALVSADDCGIQIHQSPLQLLYDQFLLRVDAVQQLVTVFGDRSEDLGVGDRTMDDTPPSNNEGLYKKLTLVPKASRDAQGFRTEGELAFPV
jgi:hypothetical protein